MKYKYITVIGLIIICFSVYLIYLFDNNNGPFQNGRPAGYPDYTVQPGQTHDFGVFIGCTPYNDVHRVIMDFSIVAGQSPYIIQFYYTIDNQSLSSEYPIQSFTRSGGGNFKLAVNIPANSITVNYHVGVTIENIGSNSVLVQKIQASEINYGLGYNLWLITGIIGLIIALIPFIILLFKNRNKAPAVEPVLRWTKMTGAEGGPNGQYPAKSHSQKKAVQKSNGNKNLVSNRCPKCNEIIPKNVTNCPHCYAIIK